jgi:putative endonuclease
MSTEWWVYLIECADNSLYCGITTDCSRREWEHNHSKKGAKYTRSRRPIIMVWNKKCDSRSEASKLECSIKKMNRQDKLNLIQCKTNL